MFGLIYQVQRLFGSQNVNCCKDRLVNFTLTAQSDPSTATPYSYTDPGGPGQDSYTVVPSPRISFPVSLVRFDTADSTNILTLCEVFVFGVANAFFMEKFKTCQTDDARPPQDAIIAYIERLVVSGEALMFWVWRRILTYCHKDQLLRIEVLTDIDIDGPPYS
ncbi:hypothetical protein RRG08_001153 [Elysia crispata]|uniref:Uncharacterized protein n=1 Tax=Elysia crispata TaxID=231223 RepID=A0AAE0ZWJ3_9GAST|nr:hypothetical protein RRG08_001153 [Elysia crispata]